tara:strand:+ start:1939 stop:3732 length:1794 start_codon:yes stop_codon:yes gene_type:complete
MEIILFFFISSVILVFTGRFFLQRFGVKLDKKEFSFSEQGFFGLIFLSFLSLVLNFFFKIDQTLATIVLLIPIIQLILEFQNLNKFFIKNFLMHSLLIALLCALFISFDNVYRPDAGIYHLPYIKILNDFKIFSGVVTLNPVFGTTSILQYTSAIFNNFIFKDIGITIPLAILTIYLIEYFVAQFFKKNKSSFYLLYLFLILAYIFLEMNRYSEYGNDNPAHLSLFYLLSLIIKKDFKIDLSINFKIITLVSLFTFLNKVFFILVLFLPIAIWIKKKLYLDKNFLPIFSLFFFSIWIIKNIFISGCAIYPVSISCNNNLSWYSDKPKFIVAANNLSQFSELHAKMWSEIVDDNKFVNYQENKNEKDFFLKNFNWLFSDKKAKNLKYGYFKIFNNYIFVIIILLVLLMFKNNLKKNNFEKFNFEKKTIFIISIISVLLAFYKFPLGRYATSYYVLLIFFSFVFLFKSRINILLQKQNLKILTILLMICGSIFFLKNFSRIITNISSDYYQAPWPRIYENKNDLKNLSINSNKPKKHNFEIKENILKIYYINKLNYWTSDRSVTCMYNSSPCAQTSKNFGNFKVTKTSNNYFIIKLLKD